MQHLFKEQTTNNHFFINSLAGLSKIITVPVMVVFALIFVVAIALVLIAIYPHNALKNMFERWRFSSELRKDGKYILPPILKLCSMNRNAKKEHQRILTKTFTSAIIKHLKKGLKNKVTNEELDASVSYLYDLDVDIRKDYVTLLFKLAIATDGIQNDEWDFIQSIISRLDFDKESINFFNKKYAPLYAKAQKENDKPVLKIEAKSIDTDNLLPYFVDLGLNEKATLADAEQALHLLALINHPDLPQNQNRVEECEQLMEKYNEAYQKIANASKQGQ